MADRGVAASEDEGVPAWLHSTSRLEALVAEVALATGAELPVGLGSRSSWDDVCRDEERDPGREDVREGGLESEVTSTVAAELEGTELAE